MPNNDLGSLRRSQAISTYGPGAIADFRASGKGATVSVVTAGLDEWDDSAKKAGLANDQVIYEPRLQRKLGVKGFRLPPVAPETRPGIPAKYADRLVGVRFPTWLQCPQCHALKHVHKWDEEEGNPAPYCHRCSEREGVRVYVIAARYIVACENGHLDEFPWILWVPHKENCPKTGSLELRGSKTAGLAGLTLVCKDCGQSRTMEGCFDPGEIRRFGGCKGRRPWLSADDDAPCAIDPRALQRGATNLYFSVVESALDIPPWSDPVLKRLQEDQHWNHLAELAPEKRTTYAEMFGLGKKFAMTNEALIRWFEECLGRLEQPTSETLRWEEYSQFVEHDQPFGAESEFELRPEKVPPELAPWLESLVVATRLREVRAIRGFTRINPPTGGDTRVAPIQVVQRDWLPAIEVRGEGVFLQLNKERLAKWENGPAKKRAERVNKRYQEKLAQRGGEPRQISARFLLVHTLAHALIRQLSLTCGYAGASLRERLYVGTGAHEMAGLLIYTAAPDADGTLGGLAREGRADMFSQVLEGGIHQMRWCSSDPLCIEDRHGLSHQLNLAACHACVLASETSCEEFNSLLDRASLIGRQAEPTLGFFRDLAAASDTEGL